MRYLFDEDKAMTLLSRMQATKNILTEAQRVGLCSLTSREMVPSGRSSKLRSNFDHGHGAVGSQDYRSVVLSYGTGNTRYVCFFCLKMMYLLLIVHR
jgi:hypothetical protein